MSSPPRPIGSENSASASSISAQQPVDSPTSTSFPPMDTTLKDDSKPLYELPPMTSTSTDEGSYWGPPKPSSPFASPDDEDSKAKLEPSPPSIPASLPPAASRKAAAKAAKKEVKAEPVPIPLISHLPEAGAEAQETFTKLEGNHHQYKTLGRSNQDEDSMICDCSYKHGQSAFPCVPRVSPSRFPRPFRSLYFAFPLMHDFYAGQRVSKSKT